jgi:calbindin D28
MGDILDKIKNDDADKSKEQKQDAKGDSKSHYTEEDLNKMSNEEKTAAKENFLMQFREANKLNSVHFMKIWENYDKSKTGVLEANEVDAFLEDLLHVQGRDTDPASVQECKSLVLQTFDVNKDGKLELSELAQLLPVEDNFIRKFPHDRSKLSREDFDAIFKHYDVAETGYIEENELVGLLKDIFQSCGQNLGANDIIQYAKAVMEIHDSDNDGRLSRDDIKLLLAHS